MPTISSAGRGSDGEALEDRQALGVGPVEVLEHDQPGCLAEPHVDGCEHATDWIVALESVVGQHRPDQLVGPPERPVLGLPAEHHRPGRGRRDQLAQQPRLADARLAGDERDGRAAVVASPVLVDVRLAGAKTVELVRPAKRARGADRPTIVGLRPVRPTSIVGERTGVTRDPAPGSWVT